MRNINKNGFGIIEIILVLVLLTAVGVGLYLALSTAKDDGANVTTNSSVDGDDVTANSELSQIHSKLEIYYNENAVYPSTLDDPALGLSTEKITDGAGTKYQYETVDCDSSGCKSYKLQHKLNDPSGPYNDGNGYIIKKSLN